MSKPDEEQVEGRLMNWKQQAKRLHQDARVSYFACKHPRVPWYAKLVAGSTAVYVFSPVQLIPSFIPVIGFLDDLLVLFLGVKLLLRIVPPDVLTECREQAESAESRRKEEITSVAAIAGFAVIATLWLLAGVGASALIATYIPR